MKIKEITDYLESLAPLHLQESYDNSGLIVGNPNDSVSGILISLDATENVLDEALEKKCNMVVAHHPIVFSGLKKFNGKNYVERTVIKAIKNNIALYAIHTNLDNVLHGVNDKISEKLGLKNRTILKPTDSEGTTGSGMIGDLQKPLTGKDFLAFLKTQMELTCIRHTPLLNEKISKVALCGGAGSFLLNEAIKNQADVFITGDYKYHQFFDAEKHLLIADIGHYESEVFTKELLRERLTEKFPEFRILECETNTNPVNYFF